MNLCPSCNNIMHQKQSKNGIYFHCEVCNYQAWSYNLLKKESFEPKPLREILHKVKSRNDNLFGSCVSCENAYFGLDHTIEGLPVKLYVCPNCKEIVLHRSHLNHLPKITIVPKREEPIFSSNTMEAMKQVDEAILKNERKWKRYDQISKVSSVKFIIIMMVVFFSLAAALSLIAFKARSSTAAVLVILGSIIGFAFLAYKFLFKRNIATEIYRALNNKKL